MFTYSFFRQWQPFLTGFCVLLILVFGSFWELPDVPNPSSMFRVPEVEPVGPPIAFSISRRKDPGSLVHPNAQLALGPLSGSGI